MMAEERAPVPTFSRFRGLFFWGGQKKSRPESPVHPYTRNFPFWNVRPEFLNQLGDFEILA